MFHVHTNIYHKRIHQQASIYNNKLYNTLYYDETMICTDDMETGMYRSTIISIPERKLLAFAPPKSLSWTKFKSLYPSLENIVMHEYIDSRMLQLFYDDRIRSWIVRPIMTNQEYKLPINIDEHAFIIAAQGNISQPLNELAILEYLPKNYSYTFAIRKQYTFHSSLYLLAVYQIHEANMITYIPQNVFQHWSVFANINGVICFPKEYSIGNSYTDLMEDIYYNYTPKKWVLTNNQTGLQTNIATNEYKLMKRSEELNSWTKYQYLCLQRSQCVDIYINFYPSYKRQFYPIKQLYDWFLRTVHEMYIHYYIKKTVTDIPLKYKNHIEQIHKLYYLKSLNNKKPRLVNKDLIKQYFDRKSPYELQTILNTYEYIMSEYIPD